MEKHNVRSWRGKIRRVVGTKQRLREEKGPVTILSFVEIGRPLARDCSFTPGGKIERSVCVKNGTTYGRVVEPLVSVDRRTTEKKTVVNNVARLYVFFRWLLQVSFSLTLWIMCCKLYRFTLYDVRDRSKASFVLAFSLSLSLSLEKKGQWQLSRLEKNRSTPGAGRQRFRRDSPGSREFISKQIVHKPWTVELR